MCVCERERERKREGEIDRKREIQIWGLIFKEKQMGPAWVRGTQLD